MPNPAVESRGSHGLRGAALSAILLAALFASGCFSARYRSKPRVGVVDGDPIVQMQKARKMPHLDWPRLVPYTRHSDPPQSDERVVGLRRGAEARAYPLGLLDQYEVVNDRMGELDYVVARCALTEITAIFDRRVAGRTLTFVNSGALWRDTLVLQDRETGTLWTAATGLALYGPLAGERLEMVPALFTTTREWRRSFPGSLYLDTGDLTEQPVVLRLYGVSPWQGISGVKTRDARYDPKQEVFAVAEGSEAFVFTAEELEGSGPLRTVLSGRPVDIDLDVCLGAPRAWEAGPPRREIAVVPMYWFAADRHFETVRTFRDIMPEISTAQGERK